MDENNFFYATLLCCIGAYVIKKRKLVSNRKKKTKLWVRPIYLPEQRNSQGLSSNLIKELRHTDQKKFTNWMRMSPTSFDRLLNIVRPAITKKYVIREPIDPKLKLELTLR